MTKTGRIMIVLSRTSVTGEYNPCDFALITITQESAREMLKRREALKHLTAPYKVVYWDSAAEAIDTDEQEAPEQWHEIDTYKVLPEPASETLNRCRTECCTAQVTEEGVFWRAILKHADVYVDTEEIPWSVFEEVADG